MKPRRTHRSTTVFTLTGGTEGNDLYAEQRVMEETGNPVLGSVWVPTDEERQQIAAGWNVKLWVWGESHPPVAILTTDEPLGAAPRGEEEPQ